LNRLPFGPFRKRIFPESLAKGGIAEAIPLASPFPSRVEGGNGVREPLSSVRAGSPGVNQNNQSPLPKQLGTGRGSFSRGGKFHSPFFSPAKKPESFIPPNILKIKNHFKQYYPPAALFRVLEGHKIPVFSPFSYKFHL
jgi:hypothetical protein